MATSRVPVVGITPDIYLRETTARDGSTAVMPTWRVAETYAKCVSRAGGVPIVLSPMVEHARAQAAMVDAVVFTGGDDPIMEEFGVIMHPEATPVVPDRQAFELALFSALWDDPRDVPVLGVCLGMQYMAIRAGGAIDQHMPETTGSAGDHWERVHRVSGDTGGESEGWAFGAGEILSKHRQAITDPGSLRVLARAHDGTIEAVGAMDRRFWLGVQWHPERTAAPGLGQAIFDALIAAVPA